MASKAQLMVECAKRKIKGFQGKSEEELQKMIEEHDAALEGKTSSSKKSSKPPKEEEPEEEEDVNIEEEEEEEPEEEEEIVEEEEEEPEEEEEIEEEEETKPTKKETKMAKKEKEVVEKKVEKKVSPKDKVEKKIEKVAEKTAKPKVEGKGRGKGKQDKVTMLKENGSPFGEKTSMNVYFKLFSKAGEKGISKTKCIELAKEYMTKKEIKCNNPESRFGCTIVAVNSNPDLDIKIEKNDNDRYVIVKR